MHLDADDFTAILHIKDPKDVEKEVRSIVSLMHPDFDFTLFSVVFRDVCGLFEGGYPGYRACNTEYHDLAHTLDVLLATARLCHGVHLDREPISARSLELGLAAALLHDVGYIQSLDDQVGTGAKYTFTHVDRSVEFMVDYRRRKGLGDEFERACATVIQATDLAREIKDIPFPGPADMLMAWIVATADIVGQVADRIYLEKLPCLYREFDEAGSVDFESEYDLLRKTMGFYKFMQFRMEHHLGDVNACMAAHFKARYGLEADLYALYTQKNMDYLQHLLATHGRNCTAKLRQA